MLFLKGGIRTYEIIRELENEGIRSFFRPPEARNLERKNNTNKKEEWFKTRTAKENKFTAVMFVKATPQGELVKKLNNSTRLMIQKGLNLLKKVETKSLIVSILLTQREIIAHLKQSVWPVGKKESFQTAKKKIFVIVFFA